MRQLAELVAGLLRCRGGGPAHRAIFENGVLRPVEPLEGVAENSVVELMLRAIGRPSARTPSEHTEDFWSCRSLEELARGQGVQPVDDLTKLAADFWPDEESADDLIDFVARERPPAAASPNSSNRRSLELVPRVLVGEGKQ